MKLLIPDSVSFALKSPNTIKLSYFDDCEPSFFPRVFKWFFMSALRKFYEQLSNQLVFIKLVPITFLDNKKLKIVWKKITTFFKRRVSIILSSFSS